MVFKWKDLKFEGDTLTDSRNLGRPRNVDQVGRMAESLYFKMGRDKTLVERWGKRIYSWWALSIQALVRYCHFQREKERIGSNRAYFSILPKAGLQAGMISEIDLSVLLKVFFALPRPTALEFSRARQGMNSLFQWWTLKLVNDDAKV